ncbi:MAG TPA: PilZ domain-containing protein, partial [Polyangiaceae bacterium]|nr:PilZ domain-containing protein [Polyangiaceae bacterium]
MRGHENLALYSLILYREWTTEAEMNTEDRRAPGAVRMPFEGLVEVGGALGPSFEAKAVDVSEEGIHLRTAYLPEQGQPLTCRFDGGPGQSVLASGEVVWAAGAEGGGEFGVRFTDMDHDSVDALKKIIGVPGVQHAVVSGSKVRLHIDGLASPMRAKIKDARATAVTVGSDLGFLQVGRQLELEDAQSGAKRPACIDRVDVAVDPTSNVPQLVVTLRYADVETAPAPVDMPAPAAMPAMPAGDDLASAEEASRKMKGAVAHTIAQMGPALGRFAERARTMAVLLAKRRQDGKHESSARRTTAPPPNGGLYTSGRRVFRGSEGSPSSPEGVLPAPFRTHKAKAVVAGAVMLTAIAGALALKKAHSGDAPPQAVAAAAPPPVTSVPEAPAALPVPAVAPVASSAALAPAPTPVAVEPLAAADDTDSTRSGHKKHVHVPPFGNGPVHHGNVLRLKMDAPIESLEGAQQPTGFAVKIPGRRSLEAAGPLAARDTRI